MSLLVVHKHAVRTALVLAFVVIVLGAYTRLVDAGLGCPDWPGCYGFMIMPVSETEIQEANQRFSDQPFEVSKAIPEVVHRVVAGGLGLLILLISLLAWRTKKKADFPTGYARARAISSCPWGMDSDSETMANRS